MIEYEIKKKIAELGSTARGGKVLTLISWHGGPDKLDIRQWMQSEEGERAGKGITLTEAEARKLAAALQAYFTEQEAPGTE